jgi:hypothetical protein
MIIEKHKPLRNRRLLNLAHRINECQFQIAGVCQGYSAHGCEPIHSDHQEHGKGMGQKSDDDQHVAGCRACHNYYSGAMPREERLPAFNAGRERTFDQYRKRKWLNKVGYADRKANG